MKRIETSTRAIDMFGPNKDGFQAAVPGASEATRVSPEWFNHVQESLVRTIEAAGMELSDMDYDQFVKALGILIKASIPASTPAGTIIWHASASAPGGYLKANGAAISRTTYADLFAAIGTTFGAGDGSTTFNLPDLRGEFIRGYDDGRDIDSGREFASGQSDEIKSHTHEYTKPQGGVAGFAGGTQFNNVTNNSTTAATGGGETRPRNVALLACIKY